VAKDRVKLIKSETQGNSKLDIPVKFLVFAPASFAGGVCWPFVAVRASLATMSLEKTTPC
jgi:hypothetical protein